MACGKNNTPRITQQVQQILKTLKPAPIELQQLAGFIGQCYIFSDLSIKNPHTIIVDTTNARIGHYNSRTKRFYEVITRGEWTTVPFVIDPTDSKHQAIGKHTAIFLAGFISTRTPEHIENLINSGYFNDFSVNHQTGNVNDDQHLEATTEKQNNLHGKILNRLADLFAGSALTYIPDDAKRKGKAVERHALRYPLSIKEIQHVYRDLKSKNLIPRPKRITPTTTKKYEDKVVELIAQHIAPVWLKADHYLPSYPAEDYPLHDDLLYKYQRRAVLSAYEAQKQLQAEAYHADYCFYQYEEQHNKLNAEVNKLSA